MTIPDKVYIRKNRDFTDELCELWHRERALDDDIKYIRSDEGNQGNGGSNCL